jgi:tetratricopeptide (TPR) repeat protein
MSSHALACQDCHVECTYDRAVRFGEGMYGVVWRCPRCRGDSLDLCPVGPLVPTAESCLNCGKAYSGAAACAACGLARADVLPALGIAAEPGDAIAEADALAARGLFRAAFAALNRGLIRDPTAVGLWDRKRQYLVVVGLAPLGAEMAESALDAGAPAELLYVLGRAYQDAGDHAEAVGAYRQYREARPDGGWVAASFANEGNSARALGDDLAAEGLYRRAIDRDPAQPVFRYNLARLLADHGRWDEVIAEATRGATGATGPAATRLHALRALAHAERMEADEAVRCAEAARAESPNDVQANYLVGRGLALLGRLEEARAAMRRVLELDPGNADATRGLTMIEDALKPRPWWKVW